MKEMIRYGFTLAVTCIVAAGLLAGVNSLTKSRIMAQALAGEEASLKEVLPEGVSFEAVKKDNEIIYYKAMGKDNQMIGVVFKASGKGYSSTIETMVGMLVDGTIVAIKVLSQNETPGLGANVTGAEFAGQFKKQNATQLPGVQAITGATISSRAVMDSIKKKAEETQALIKHGE